MGFHRTFAPNPEGVKRCIRGAVADAGINPAEVDAINGHLTATYADPLEVRNWAVGDWSELPTIFLSLTLQNH